MPHRDPETGQFVEEDQFDDYEVVTFSLEAGIPAADQTGVTDFDGQIDELEGQEVVDYDDIIDRNERAHLLQAWHRLIVYINSTETADGYVAGSFEIATSPAKQAAEVTPATADLDNLATSNRWDGAAATTDTIDVVGRPLLATASGPFSDGATGVGGAGTGGDDQVHLERIPGEIGAFHPRDELYVNGETSTWNVSDAATHTEVMGQHWYGISESDR